jgi:UDP-N-acetylglucosamine 2-epimerase (non-hydrolysing)
MTMKLLTVVGARPNFMKAAPIIAAVRNYNQAAACRVTSQPQIEHKLVHTGQHYDSLMSDVFFADLGMPAPDIHLGAGAGSPTAQSAEILTRFEAVLLGERPDLVIVIGDVNSTLACALVVAKASFDSAGSRPLLAHVEAGLRSFDRTMPEEVNRVLTDHLCDFLFVTEESGVENLMNEGIPSDRIHFVGNTMIDSLLAFERKAEASTILTRLDLRRTPYALLTLHRPSNVDNPETIRRILAGLDELADEIQIVLPVHPRTRKRLAEFGLTTGEGASIHLRERTEPDLRPGKGRVSLVDPLGYLDFLCLMKHARIVVTDSGGIQEETTTLGVPCVTVRENTERPVTIRMGTNVLAGTTTEGIRASIRQQLKAEKPATAPPYWDGQAATRIVGTLVNALSRRGASAVFASA